MDTFKTLKYRITIYLYSLYLLSNRKEAFLITPLPNSQFIYNASKIWNTIRETIAKSDLTISICSLKSTLKKHIISLQKFGTFYEWVIKRLSFLLIKKKIWGNKKDISSFYKIPLILYTFFMSTNEKLIYGWIMCFLWFWIPRKIKDNLIDK